VIAIFNEFGHVRFLPGPLTCLVREVATDATFEASVPYDCQSSQAASDALTMIATRTRQIFDVRR
jgi:hypothetical protein